MIAILASLGLALYIVIPGWLFKYFCGKIVPLRNIALSKSDELTHALFSTIVPFVAAFALMRHVPVVQDHPFGFPDNEKLRSADYRLVLGTAYSEELFKKNEIQLWPALSRSLKRQGRFLIWYYLSSAIQGVAIGLLIREYGKRQNSKAGRWFVEHFLLPHVSEWHVLLTPFMLPGGTITADLLCSNELLYSGEVKQHFVDKDGKLSGIILKNPRRFDRDRLIKDRENGINKSKDEYWREIPSAKLHFSSDKIVNMNLNHHSPELVKRYFVKGSPKRLPNPGQIYVRFKKSSAPAPEQKKPDQS